MQNGHPRDLKKWPFDRGAVKAILAVTKLYWPLLTGGHCSEVTVSSGLTVYVQEAPFNVMTVNVMVQLM